MQEQSQSFDFGGNFAWFPSAEIIEKSNLTRFMRKHNIGSYDELLRRSTDDIEWFWKSVLSDLRIRFSKPFETLVDPRGGIARPRWCVGGEMNIVDNLLDRYEGTRTDSKIALRCESESGDVRTLTYAQLRSEANRCANALRCSIRLPIFCQNSSMAPISKAFGGGPTACDARLEFSSRTVFGVG